MVLDSLGGKGLRQILAFYTRKRIKEINEDFFMKIFPIDFLYKLQ